MSTTTSLDPYAIAGSAALKALQQNQVDHVVTVPDWVQLSLHRLLEDNACGIRVTNTTNENQSLTVAAGLTIGGARPLVMMQNQGFYNCINTLRAVCLDAHVPMVLMVGQFGREYPNMGQDPRGSSRSMVAIMEPILETLKLPYWRLESPADLVHMSQAFATAQARQTAAVLLVGAPMAWR